MSAEPNEGNLKDHTGQATDFAGLFARLDQLAKQGAHTECREALQELNPRNLPRDWAPAFGELAFRVKVPLFSLKALHPYIYPKNSFSAAASDKEKMIFATALFSLGASTEAKELLQQISEDSDPEALFYQAIVNFTDWNYAEAIPFLKKYISLKTILPYRKLVGMVNLAAALIFNSEFAEARKYLDLVKAECEKNSHTLLLGNSYELLAQADIYQARYLEALEHLQTAETLLKNEGGLFAMFVEKWKAIAVCLNSASPQNLARLKEMTAQAETLQHWNSLRECHLFEAVITQNEELIKQLIMGCPSPAYRQRARQLFGKKISTLGEFYWVLGNDEKVGGELPVFDPYSSGCGTEPLYEKPLLLNIFDALTQDFYKPSHLGFIFQRIYPGEKFNPYTSPPRILQGLRRLDKWFCDNHWPLRVVFKKSEFRLNSLQPITVKLKRNQEVTAVEGKLTSLKSHFPDRSFSVQTAAAAMEISRASAQRLINEAVASGKLVASGNLRNKTYCFNKQKRSRKQAA